VAVLDKIDESLEGKDKKSKPKIEAAIDKFCSKKELSASEKKVVRAESPASLRSSAAAGNMITLGSVYCTNNFQHKVASTRITNTLNMR
jgi:hypothetical protein